MADFTSIAADTLKVEAGYQALAKDTGNYNSKKELVGTNHGVSAQTYERWLGHPPTEAEMRAITTDTALAIFRKWYWNPIQGDAIANNGIARFIFDFYINSGNTSLKFVRRSLGLPEATLPMLSSEAQLLNHLTDPAGFLSKLRQARIDFINDSTKIDASLKAGLVNRVEDVYADVKKKSFQQSQSTNIASA